MANNQVIDCTNYESALLSIQTCIGIEKDILAELITKLDYNKKHKIFVEVLNYIYDKLHAVELSQFTFCHDQKGLSISADDVLSIEELNQVRIQ